MFGKPAKSRPFFPDSVEDILKNINEAQKINSIKDNILSSDPLSDMSS